ncbi:MAG: Dabb family protein [Chthoniobacteraceae bacterium]
MIHHVTLFQVLPHVDDAKLDQMMIAARVSLVKIPEVAGVRCGKNVDRNSSWGFFVAIEVDNLDRLRLVQQDSVYIKYLADVISPNVAEQFLADFEMEPGKDIKLS